jgi:hypothetical protein
MATKSKTVEEYIERRVRELLNQNWTDHDIIQQLSGFAGRKVVAAEIAKQKLASTSTH